MVKANAYGHGVLFVASAVEKLVDCFGVARLEEALSLRSQGITKPILLLEGFFQNSICRLLQLITFRLLCIIKSNYLHFNKLNYQIKLKFG